MHMSTPIVFSAAEFEYFCCAFNSFLDLFNLPVVRIYIGTYECYNMHTQHSI